MSFHPLKGQDVHEKESVEAPVRDMEKPAAGDIRGRIHVPVGAFVRGLKGARCPFTGAFQNVGLKIRFEKSIVSLMWVT
jgi:hypothetical protein